MRYVLTLCALLLTACGSGRATEQASPPPIAAPAPPPVAPITVIVVGNSAADTLRTDSEACCADVVGPLGQAGFLLETLDAPCHGQDFCTVRGGLEGWAEEVTARNTEWLDRFCSRLRTQIANRPVFVAGISRGGYAALSCNLGAPVRGIIAYAPVTDLYRLTEFAGVPRVTGYELLPQRVPTLIRIGQHDERVGTDAAVAYANSSGAELGLLDSPGHTAPENGGGIAWISAR